MEINRGEIMNYLAGILPKLSYAARALVTKRRLYALSMVMLLLITTVTPPIALASKETVVPPPAMPSKPVRRGPNKVQITEPKFSLSSYPSDQEICSVRIFATAFAPMHTPAVSGENRDLAAALVAFKKKSDSYDVSNLVAFIKSHPKSRWNAALKLGVGQLLYSSGYYSRAYSYWKSAWEESKGEKDRDQHAVADQTIARLTLLDARLGYTDELDGYIKDLKKRELIGSVAQMVDQAQYGLSSQRKRPDKAYKCGPLAISSLVNLDEKIRANVGICVAIDKASSTPRGTNLAQVKALSDKVGLHYQMAKRAANAPFISPAVMHWSVGHFAAITAASNGRYHVEDPTFGQDGNLWLTADVLNAETDGYFLVPDGPLPSGWSALTEKEAATVWGRGGTTPGEGYNKTPDEPTDPLSPPPKKPKKPSPGPGCCQKCGECGGMATASAFSMEATLNVQDSPLGYRTPIGPSVYFACNYNYLEAQQLQTFTYSNFGPEWNFNWTSYVSFDSSQNATVLLRGGGFEQYAYANASNSSSPYAPNLTSQAVLNVVSPSVYQRQLPDGSVEVFGQSDGMTPPNFFLTQVIDPKGNSVSIQYTAGAPGRISTITDAVGQVSTVNYVSNSPGVGYYNISSITDPFNRSASFTYATVGFNTELASSTDVLNITSSYAYDPGTGTAPPFMNQLTTPYGTTSFMQYTFPYSGDTIRVIKAQYPDGSSSVVEAASGATARNNSYYWDREAMMNTPYGYVDPEGASANYVKGTTWTVGLNALVQPVVASVTYIADGNPITYTYAGQQPLPLHAPTLYTAGPSNKPTSVSQKTPSGAVQTYSYQNNMLGKVTQSVDPIGRVSNYLYAANNIDMLEARGPNNDLLGKWTFNNNQHIPSTAMDGSGQVTKYTYNAAGQVLTVTDPLNEVTTYSYDGDGFLMQIDGPLPGNADVTTMTYDGFNRLYSTTNSEGYTTYMNYDNADRVTQITYPDGTTEQTIYNKLDAVLMKDRIGRWTQDAYDSMQQMVSETDPLGRKTNYSYCLCGALNSITDPNGNTTTFQYDNQDRLISQTYPDGTMVSYTYDDMSRVTSRLDAKNQTTNYAYNVDNTLSSVTYVDSNGLTSVTTPEADYTWDSLYQRLTQATTTFNGGSTYTSNINYAYNPYANNPFAALNLWAGGQPNVGDKVNVTFNNATLSGGKHNVQYTLVTADTNQTSNALNLGHLASSLVTAVNSDSTLSGAGFKATSSGALITVTAPTNIGSVSGVESANGPVSETISGSVTAGDVVTIVIKDSGIAAGGQLSVSYTAASGNTTTTIASGLTTAINGNSTLSGLGISATSSGAVVTITSTSPNATRYAGSVLSGTAGTLATETIAQAGGPSENVSSGGGGMLQSSNNLSIDNPTPPALTTTTVNYSYDVLGRTINRWINGQNNFIEWKYDPMSRMTTEANTLGTFAFHYLDDIAGASKGTSMLSSINYPNGQTTNFNYLPVSQDQRLAGITNVDPTGKVRSQFNYGYDSSGQILCWAQQNAGYTPVNYGLSYDQGGQLTAATAGFGSPTNSLANQYAYNYDPAANRTSAQKSAIQPVTISGTAAAGDTLTVVFTDPGLSGGTESVTFTAPTSPTLAGNAAGLAAAISADTNLQSIGVNASSYSASGSASVVKIRSLSPNTTTYTSSTTGSETLTLGLVAATNSVQSAIVGLLGAGYKPTTGDVLSIIVYDAGLTTSTVHGRESVSYTVTSSDTVQTIATHLASNINSDTKLSSLATGGSVSATSASAVVSLTSTSNNLTTYSSSVTPTAAGGSETIALGPNIGVNTTATIAGTVTTADVLTLNVRALNLNNGQETAAYVVPGGVSTLTGVASGLAAAINGDTTLSAFGISATSSAAVVTINNSTVYPTYSKSTTGTETITFGTNVNGNISATIGGTISAGNLLSITVNSPGLLGGQETISYTVQAADTLTSIAASFAAGFAGDNKLRNVGVTATSSAAILNISKIATPNFPTYLAGVTSGATETLAMGMNPNGVQLAQIAGSKTTGDTLGITIFDQGLAGGSESDTYTVSSSDTLASIATNLAAAINADTSLQALGVSASSSGTVISLKSNSTNITSYVSSISSGATETLTLGANANGVQTAVITGSATKNGDALSVTVYNPGLTSSIIPGQEAVNYTVPSNGTSLATIAAGLATAINGDAKLSAVGVTATSVSVSTSAAVLNIKTASGNFTTYSQSVTLTGGGNEAIALAPSLGSVQSFYNGLNELVGTAAGGPTTFMGTTNKPVKSASVAAQTFNINWAQPADLLTTVSTVGNLSIEPLTSPYNNGYSISVNTITTGVPVSVQFNNAGLTSNPVIISYTPTSSDTTYTVANQLNTLITANTALQAIGISATNTFGTLNIATNPTYTYTSGEGYVTMSFGGNVQGNCVATVGGTIHAGDTISLTVNFPPLSGGTASTPTYTVQSNDTTASIAAALASRYNAISSVQANGLTAAVAGNSIALTLHPTYTFTTNSGGTETMSFGQNYFGDVTATLLGAKTTGDVVTLSIHYPLGLQSGHVVSYTVQSGDTLGTIAANLSAALNADTTLQALDVKSSDQTVANLNWSENFSASPPLNSGANSLTISATDGGSNTVANTAQATSANASNNALGYDLNGNTLGDGVNQFVWDIENRLITVNYPGSGNFTSFAYDGFGRNIAILENYSGSLTSSKQFAWSMGQRIEELSATGLTTKQFLALGEVASGTNYYYSQDHLGSIREVTDTNDNIQSELSFDVYGRETQILGGFVPDFQYAKYYLHKRSELCMTLTRMYDANFGRFLSRDSVNDGDDSYTYTLNQPVDLTDATGLWPKSLGTKGLDKAETKIPQELAKWCPSLTQEETQTLSKQIIDKLSDSDLKQNMQLEREVLEYIAKLALYKQLKKTPFPCKRPVPKFPTKPGDLTEKQLKYLRNFIDSLPDQSSPAIQKLNDCINQVTAGK